ncbi:MULTISPECIES: hypothetical protein [Clostridium]|uniref:hypothetical protein n=1 Tax=Clostridium TaxID=1485 RepID=UPI002247574A|nr:hypothetical protein [Clostridium kluyveri]UZQ51588.1 hypothetical protein OP486_05250 [Clostridium kluyveri]
MPKDLSVNVNLKNTDVFKGFVKIMQDVLEDGRVPVDVKHKIRKRIKELIDKEEK